MASHYFTTEPQASDRPTEVEFVAGGHTFQLAGSGGVFSARRLDPGTAVLLRKAPLPAGDTATTMLDIGCGYGPIACVLATLAPQSTVYAVDVNSRALDLASQNARRLGLAGRLRAARPDAVPDEVRFDQIWSNPPIRVGKAELHAILTRWLPRLTPDGVAWLVVAHHLGGDSLASWLGEQGWPVRRHASQKGFRVLRVGARPE